MFRELDVFGMPSVNMLMSDLTGNGSVNFEDLTVLLADWTGPGGAASPEAALAAQGVPEPSTAVLALLGLIGLLCRAGRRPRR